jgi:NAD(P)-dependent dehydrogenase (short-subunit alcohol dehydrogenase family)
MELTIRCDVAGEERGIMDVAGSVALVTGANRGLGASLCASLLDRGAAKVYAGARDVGSVKLDGVEPIRLDITSADDIAAAVQQCGDVTLLINNAGIGTGTSALAGNAEEMAKLEFDTNVLGPLAMSRAFAPILGANGGGAMVNVLSVLAWFSVPPSALYCAAKAASLSLTNSIRLELHAQKTQVLALHVGYMDTDMTAGIDAPKSSPDDVAAQVMDGLEAGALEVLADEVSRNVRAALSADLTALYPTLVS